MFAGVGDVPREGSRVRPRQAVGLPLHNLLAFYACQDFVLSKGECLSMLHHEKGVLDPSNQDLQRLVNDNGCFVHLPENLRALNPLFAVDEYSEGEVRGDAANEFIQALKSSGPALFSSVFWPDAERRERDFKIFEKFLDERGDLRRIRCEH